MIPLHLRGPRAAVGVEAHQRLLGEGDSGVRHAVAQLALYLERSVVIDAQDSGIRKLVEGGLVVDGVVVAFIGGLALDAVSLFCSNAGLMCDLQYGRLTRINA